MEVNLKEIADIDTSMLASRTDLDSLQTETDNLDAETQDYHIKINVIGTTIQSTSELVTA